MNRWRCNLCVGNWCDDPKCRDGGWCQAALCSSPSRTCIVYGCNNEVMTGESVCWAHEDAQARFQPAELDNA